MKSILKQYRKSISWTLLTRLWQWSKKHEGGMPVWMLRQDEPNKKKERVSFNNAMRLLRDKEFISLNARRITSDNLVSLLPLGIEEGIRFEREEEAMKAKVDSIMQDLDFSFIYTPIAKQSFLVGEVRASMFTQSRGHTLEVVGSISKEMSLPLYRWITNNAGFLVHLSNVKPEWRGRLFKDVLYNKMVNEERGQRFAQELSVKLATTILETVYDKSLSRLTPQLRILLAHESNVIRSSALAISM